MTRSGGSGSARAPVVVHIGANKTASTTLQRALFARSPRISYLGEDCERYEVIRETLDSLVWDDDLHYQRDAVKELFGRALAMRGGRTLVYSNEDIMRSRVPALCAGRIRELLPEAEIVMVVRNQLTALPSWYTNHGAYLKGVPRRYWRRYVSFDEWMSHCLAFLNYSPLDGFFYQRQAALYATLFGRDRIHVLLYEDFVGDRDRFVKDFCAILGIDAGEAARALAGSHERRRYTMRTHRYHQFRSWFLPGRDLTRGIPGGRALEHAWTRLLESGAPADGFMSDAWRARIIDLYGKDNRKLADEYGLPLREHDYPLASNETSP
jgi:Sulfotransferase family